MLRVVEQPAGLRYQPEFLSDAEEAALIAFFEPSPFEEVRMHGRAAKRTVLHLGYRYDYGSARVVETDPLPPPLLALRGRAGAFAGVDAERFVEALVTRYPPGAGIGWHRDAPRFGSTVVGVSLLSPCTMRFRRVSATERRTYGLELAPRSVYVLTGSARWAWQHSIPATKGLRYSVTFRTLRGGAEPDAGRAAPQ